MKRIEDLGYKTKVNDLSKKIINLIEKENPENKIILATLSSLMQTFCETINLPEEDFRDFMQAILNDYRNSSWK